ncbi:hypothetical protein BT69DRAFT_624284 [Atractiella rhizophila]|nr:hypothetical protein BT69DRAFT_624284 [Atractiella rhizophila]
MGPSFLLLQARSLAYLRKHGSSMGGGGKEGEIWHSLLSRSYLGAAMMDLRTKTLKNILIESPALWGNVEEAETWIEAVELLLHSTVEETEAIKEWEGIWTVVGRGIMKYTAASEELLTSSRRQKDCCQSAAHCGLEKRKEKIVRGGDGDRVTVSPLLSATVEEARNQKDETRKGIAVRLLDMLAIAYAAADDCLCFSELITDTLGLYKEEKKPFKKALAEGKVEEVEHLVEEHRTELESRLILQSLRYQADPALAQMMLLRLTNGLKQHALERSSSRVKEALLRSTGLPKVIANLDYDQVVVEGCFRLLSEIKFPFISLGSFSLVIQRIIEIAVKTVKPLDYLENSTRVEDRSLFCSLIPPEQSRTLFVLLLDLNTSIPQASSWFCSFVPHHGHVALLATILLQNVSTFNFFMVHHSETLSTLGPQSAELFGELSKRILSLDAWIVQQIRSAEGRVTEAADADYLTWMVDVNVLHPPLAQIVTAAVVKSSSSRSTFKRWISKCDFLDVIETIEALLDLKEDCDWSRITELLTKMVVRRSPVSNRACHITARILQLAPCSKTSLLEVAKSTPTVFSGTMLQLLSLAHPAGQVVDYLDQGLLWLVRRFAEDAEDGAMTVGFVEGISSIAVEDDFSWPLKTHILDPLFTAAFQNRLEKPYAMELLARLLSRFPKMNATKLLQMIISHRSLKPALSLSSLARIWIVRILEILFTASPQQCINSGVVDVLLSHYHHTTSAADIIIRDVLCKAEFLFNFNVSDLVTSQYNRKRLVEYIHSLDSEKARRTCRFVLRPDRASREEDVYDVQFLLPLLGATFEGGKLHEEILASDIFPIVFLGLSSPFMDVRRMSRAVLMRIQEGIKASPLEEMTLILSQLQNIFVQESHPRISAVVTMYLAQSFQSIFSPETEVYVSSIRFFLQRPEIDTEDVPLIYPSLFPASRERRREMIRFVEYLKEAMVTYQDWKILRRRQVWELLTNLATSRDNELRRISLEFMANAVRDEKTTKDLVLRLGLLAWLRHYPPSTSDDEAMAFIRLLHSLSISPGLPKRPEYLFDLTDALRKWSSLPVGRSITLSTIRQLSVWSLEAFDRLVVQVAHHNLLQMLDKFQLEDLNLEEEIRNFHDSAARLHYSLSTGSSERLFRKTIHFVAQNCRDWDLAPPQFLLEKQQE